MECGWQAVARQQGGQSDGHGAWLVQQGRAATNDCIHDRPSRRLRACLEGPHVPGGERAARVLHHCPEYDRERLCVSDLLHPWSGAAEGPGSRDALSRLGGHHHDPPQSLALSSCTW